MKGNSLNNTRVRSTISQISRYDVRTITAKVIAEDSPFSMLVSCRRSNFDSTTNIAQPTLELLFDFFQNFFLKI